MKASFHQNIIGKQLEEDPAKVEYLDAARFKYWGLVAPVTIAGAWVEGGGVQVLAVDAAGRNASVNVTLFIIKQERS